MVTTRTGFGLKTLIFLEVDMASYWADKTAQDPQKGTGYTCPWCQRFLKPKVSTSAKNPGRSFVSCASDYGGCGLFSFLDGVPDERFNPSKKDKGAPLKKAKVDGTQVVGPIADPPDAVAQRLAELSTEVAGLRSELAQVLRVVTQIAEN